MHERMPLYFHPLYTDGIDPSARFPRERYRRVVEAVQDGDTDGLVEVCEAPRVAVDALHRVHDPAYIDAFLTGTLDREATRRIGLRPWTEAIVERTLRLTGGTLAALDRAVASGGLAANLAGGTHHAFYDRGSGYCIVNDLVVAADRARRRHGLRRVLVVDLDVHQGDGTAAMAASDPELFTLSVHCEGNFPFDKQVSDLDVGLPVGTGDEAYLEAVARALPEAFDRAEPELVLYQAGVDGLAQDKLGRLALSHDGLRARDRLVFDAVDAAGLPTVVLMGGGYGRPLQATVDAFQALFLEAGRRHRARRRA